MYPSPHCHLIVSAAPTPTQIAMGQRMRRPTWAGNQTDQTTLPLIVTQLPMMLPDGGRNPSTFARPRTLIPTRYACGPIPTWTPSCLLMGTSMVPPAPTLWVITTPPVSSRPRSTTATTTPFHSMEDFQRTMLMPPFILQNACTRILRHTNTFSVTRTGLYVAMY